MRQWKANKATGESSKFLARGCFERWPAHVSFCFRCDIIVRFLWAGGSGSNWIEVRERLVLPHALDSYQKAHFENFFGLIPDLSNPKN
jgi:hypothetical protein